MSTEARAREALASFFPDGLPARLGIALSGGGDSTALLLLSREWAPEMPILAATVDHRLREGSGAEAKMAGALCHRLGIDHEILPWEGWPGRGNLQDAARSARRALLTDWAGRHDIAHVALGHTLDDQAETVLLRLSRGSGVDGLSAMSPGRFDGNLTWLRPLLAISRSDLRGYLTEREECWIDDPSNDDPRFDRVKARTMADQLATLGLTPERLARTATHMARARMALSQVAAKVAQETITHDRGDVLIERDRFLRAPEETRFRLLAHTLAWVSSSPYRPRFDALTRLIAELQGTLHGCRVTREAEHTRIAREYAAVAGDAVPFGATWDGRWRLAGPPPPDECHIAATGEIGLAECPDWRSSRLPRSSLLAAPALWQGERLLAAPLAGLANGYSTRLCHDAQHLVSSLLAD